MQKGGLLSTTDKNVTVQATKSDIKQLDNLTGQAYQDAVKKLPDTIQPPASCRPPTTSRPAEEAAAGS